MSPSEYVLSVMRQFPDNEMTCNDLRDWQSETSFDKVALYNALSYLHMTGKVVKHREGRATWWAIARAAGK